MPPRDPYRYFRVEARELLDALQRGVLDLEKGSAVKESVAALLRCAHTLKGAARVVRVQPMAEAAHQVETELEALREGGETVPAGLSGRLLALLDGMDASLHGLGSEAPSARDAVPAVAAADPVPVLDPRRVESVRLEVAELDGVMEGLREASGRLTLLRQQAQGLDRTALEQAGRELEGAYAQAGRMRLLPASVLFSFLERTCRDAAEALGKPVRFEAAGGEQRLDAPVLLALQEALQHVVRNAVVHGIEEPSQRSRASKAAQGSVRVELTMGSGRAVFRCSDDGRGLDPAAVARAAQARGLLAAGATLSMEEAAALLLRGGVSTSKGLSELAGRGLGLDILRETVERLRGSLQLESQPGRGLALRLEVPASLSAYAVLEVEAGGLPALLPFGSVRSALRLRTEDLSRGAEGEAVLTQGEAVPLLPLDSLFGGRRLRPRVAVLLTGKEGSAALGVDRIQGVREALILPLPELAPSGELALGACLDAAGDPCLLLDPESLVRRARQRRATEDEGAPQRLPVLVVDDSLTTRMLEQSILETAGYEVDLAASAEEGLVRLRQRPYGLLLVDVEMPGMSGFELLELLQKDPQLKGLPAILVTSRASAEDKRRGAAAGARDYIAKGEFDQSRLLARIRELLG